MTKISSEQLQLLSMLERETGAQAFDVLLTPESIVFVVKAGDLGKAIGKNGANRERLERMALRKVELVEFAETLEGFLANLFKPARIEKITASGTSVVLKVGVSEKGLAIGRGGSKINRARELVKRHYGVEELKVM